MSKVISMTDVVERTNLSRRTLYNLISQGKFPRQVQLSARRVGWLTDSVDEWIEQRSKAGAAA